MNEIVLNSSVMPVLGGCDYLAAAEPFFHVDRTADFHVLILVTEGVIYVTEEDVDYAVREGELLFLKSGVRHYGRTEIPRGTKWYFAHFACDADESLPRFSPDSAPIPQYSSLRSSLVLPKYIKGISGGETERIFAQLCEYFHSGEKFKQWDINARLFALLSHIALRQFDGEGAQRLSDKICAYLAAHYCEPFSADALSRAFFLSYKRLAAVFKQEKDMTMQQYHTSLRINEACRLLRSTLMSVGEVSAAIGYADVLYFSRCFRRSTGNSPTEYRRLSKY